MISTLLHPNSFLLHAALNLFGILLLAVTLCVVLPFFLVIVIIGAASDGAYALDSRWNERRGRRYGARGRDRLSFFTSSGREPADSTLSETKQINIRKYLGKL
jgi:hypothetical protein